MLFRFPMKYFLIEKFPVCILHVGVNNGASSKESMVAALGILCEGIFVGSSMGTLSGAQLLLYWSHFPCGVMGGG